MILETAELSPAELKRRTGWEIKPEGACRGDLCVPLGGEYSLPLLASRLGMPLIEDAGTGIRCLGPESGLPLGSAVAPDFTLPDQFGEPFSLSSLRGRKVLLLAWAPW